MLQTWQMERGEVINSRRAGYIITAQLKRKTPSHNTSCLTKPFFVYSALENTQPLSTWALNSLFLLLNSNSLVFSSQL